MFFSVYTLGCKLNQLETEAITDSFCREGFSFVPWDSVLAQSPHPSNSPSILVINTCTVTSMAEQKARRLIRKAMRQYPQACFIVTGCYAQMEGEALSALGKSAFSNFFVIGEDKKDQLLDLPRFLVTSGIEPRHAAVPHATFELISSWFASLHSQLTPGGSFRFRPENFASHSRAFLKVQDGCDRSCAYCRVSLARGKSRSLTAKEALEELISLERRGFSEAVLTGVNISQYRDSGMNLSGLLGFLLEGTQTIRIRLSSIEPEPKEREPNGHKLNFGSGFASLLVNKRIRPHFHLSAQSGSSKVLKKMGRLYTADDIENLAATLRGAKEDPFLACDIIAGFPGETSDDFEKTYRLCEKIGFAWIHAFPFSPRPGTAAYEFPEKVSEKDSSERVKLLTALARKGRREYTERWKGKEVEAVVEADESLKKGFTTAVSENYLKLSLNYGEQPAPTPGTLVRCRITGEQGIELDGEETEDRLLCLPV